MTEIYPNWQDYMNLIFEERIDLDIFLFIDFI